MAEVTFVLPALNEGRGIGSVLDRIPVSEFERMGYRVNVWVLDGRSTDATVEVARSKGAKVMFQQGRGKGRAVSQAFKTIRSDYVFMLDADNTYDPIDTLRMMPLLEDGHDVVMGSRLEGSIVDDAMTKRNMLGNKLISSAASVLYGHSVSDLCTGFWGFKGKVLHNLTIEAKGFELEAQLFSRCMRSKLVIGEVPISYGCRNGDPTKLKSFSSGARIFWTLFWERMRPSIRDKGKASAVSARAKVAPELK